MKNLSLRGIDEDLSEHLKKLSQKEGTSLNKTVLRLLEDAVGVRGKKRFNLYHDLDDLAGTWSNREEKEFNEKIDFFEKVDKDLWK